ncbi:RanGTP-binding protein-domain-containing protein [Aspergillus falconensis]
MDAFLARTENAANQVSENVDKSAERDELLALQQRLESKIQVISPAIDMIELIAARGNTSLETAVSLTKSLRLDIQSLGQRLAAAARSEEQSQKGRKTPTDLLRSKELIKLIIQDVKRLLVRIEDAVPLMNLAITTSGAKLSTNLPATISPSRLLQASTFLTAGDTQYSISPSRAIQIGPTFTLSMYMLFASHLRPLDEEGIRETTWKEVMHKARLKLRRVPMDMAVLPGGQRPLQLPADGRTDEFAYQILVVEDLDDGRVHAFDENEPQPQSFEDIDAAGLREIIPIHQISKIFYADTGRILNISTEGETNNPVLLLKRDTNALPPRRMVERDMAGFGAPQESEPEDEIDEIQAQLDAQLIGSALNAPNPSFHESSIPDEWRLPKDLDPEWIAFEVYNENDASDTESDGETSKSPDPTEKMAQLSINADRKSFRTASPQPGESQSQPATVSNPLFNNIRTSLSLLETLLRLMSLQQFQQQSHLSINDELLNFFLEESSTTGAGGDEQHRQRLRADARRRVGWDPYDESPVKRRGEDYQYSGTPEGISVGYTRHSSEVPYTPSERPRGYQIRSRESTPETPSQIRRSVSRTANLRRDSGSRGSSVHTHERQRRGSPLAPDLIVKNTP